MGAAFDFRCKPTPAAPQRVSAAGCAGRSARWEPWITGCTSSPIAPVPSQVSDPAQPRLLGIAAEGHTPCPFTVADGMAYAYEWFRRVGDRREHLVALFLGSSRIRTWNIDLPGQHFRGRHRIRPQQRRQRRATPTSSSSRTPSPAPGSPWWMSWRSPTGLSA